MTGDREVASVLRELLTGVREVLGGGVVGMYLDGSLAIGEFDPDKSDIDFGALRHDQRPAALPYIDRGSPLAMVHQESGYWVIHRHVLREHGVALAGPLPQTLIDPVAPVELREAVRGILRAWWEPMLGHGPLLENGLYRCCAVLTMCRMVYTLRHGAITSKPIAARWAQEVLDPRWTPLIRDALAWSREQPPRLDETRAYIRHACERAERE